MEKIVPTVSASAVGPLGITHLPRLYAKAILNATGSLAEGWNSGNRGMDKWVLDDLAIEHEPFFAFLNTLPSYGEVENWVRAHAGKLDGASIAAHNERVRSFDMSDEAQQRMRGGIGTADTSLTKGVMLTDLDDWTSARVRQSARSKLDPIVPPVTCSGTARHTCRACGRRHFSRWCVPRLLRPARRSTDGFPRSSKGRRTDATTREPRLEPCNETREHVSRRRVLESLAA